MLSFTAMLYLPISRSWLFSQTAQRIYFVSALLALALIATLVGVRMAMAVAGTTALVPPASSVVRTLLYPEVAGDAVLWIGMWYFWFGFDPSHYLKKAIWVCRFVLLGTVRNNLLLFFRLSSLRIDPIKRLDLERPGVMQSHRARARRPVGSPATIAT